MTLSPLGEQPTARTAEVRIEPRSPNLSSREIEVLARVAEGLSDAEIARRLRVPLGSVRYCVRNCLVKLGAVNRPHAVALALSARLIRVA